MLPVSFVRLNWYKTRRKERKRRRKREKEEGKKYGAEVSKRAKHFTCDIPIHIMHVTSPLHTVHQIT
jgi:hypothetical protein